MDNALQAGALDRGQQTQFADTATAVARSGVMFRNHPTHGLHKKSHPETNSIRRMRCFQTREMIPRIRASAFVACTEQ